MRSTSALLLFACTAALSPFARAQNFTLTAHPQETVQNGNGNLVPFGVSSAAPPANSFASGRTMILVPARELPTVPCVLLGIEVECQSTVAVTYQSLDIHCAPVAPTTTALTSTFAANYTVPPTQVLAATNFTVNWQNDTWVPITFTSPYVHDGTSALILEIQKELPQQATYPFATMSTSSSPSRTDRPNMRYAFGLAGSNASQAATATTSANALSFRLQWQGTSTVRNRSNSGLNQTQYAVGGTVTLTVNGTAGHLYAFAADTSFLPVSVPFPGIGGALLLPAPVIFSSGVLGAGGEDVYQLNIPANPALAGFYLAYQAATIDPVSVAVTLTNGMDHFVNP
jgi:hypothetical protein